MLEKYLKEHSEKFASPFIKFCIFIGIKPNVLSIIGLLVVTLGCYLLFIDLKTLGAIVIFLGSAIDGLDGPLARKTNTMSDKGALIDSFIDRIGELFIWSVVAIKFTTSDVHLFFIFLVLSGSTLVPYLRARGETLGIDNKVGLAARPERVIFAVIYMLFSLPFTAVYIFTLILWTTVYQRFIILYKNL
ncbi:CDP-alcohol phosphatidyltransferase family protein [Acidimicrobiaceae bacterium]|nr:CDP-alcohol phosphatidyltransferase family protein [Acidimicrobiaceae bacterium]